MHARRGTPPRPESLCRDASCRDGSLPRDAVGRCSAWGPLYTLLLGERGGSQPPRVRLCWLGPTPELLAMGYRRPLLLPEPRK